jgi:hypothetical protein
MKCSDMSMPMPMPLNIYSVRRGRHDPKGPRFEKIDANDRAWLAAEKRTPHEKFSIG